MILRASAGEFPIAAFALVNTPANSTFDIEHLRPGVKNDWLGDAARYVRFVVMATVME